MIDKDPNTEAQEGLIIGDISQGKSHYLPCLIKKIQDKEKLLHQEINKSSDEFGLILGRRVFQQSQIHVLILDMCFSAKTGSFFDSEKKDYPQKQISLFFSGHTTYFDNSSTLTFAIKPSDRSDIERACNTYQSISPRWCNSEAFTHIYLQESSLLLIYDTILFEGDVNLIFPQILWQELIKYFEVLTYSISVLKRRNIQSIRCQYIANQAHLSLHLQAEGRFRPFCMPL